MLFKRTTGRQLFGRCVLSLPLWSMVTVPLSSSAVMRRGAFPVLRTSLAHFRRISCSVGVMSLRSSFWKPSGPGDLPFLSFEMNPCHSPSVSVPRKRCSCSPTSL